MIKNRLSFFLGLLFLIRFIIAVVLHGDNFTLVFTACAALLNILIGLFDYE